MATIEITVPTPTPNKWPVIASAITHAMEKRSTSLMIFALPKGRWVIFIKACVQPSAGFKTKSIATMALTPIPISVMPIVNIMQLVSRFGSWQNQKKSSPNTKSNRSIRQPNAKAKGI